LVGVAGVYKDFDAVFSRVAGAMVSQNRVYSRVTGAMDGVNSVHSRVVSVYTRLAEVFIGPAVPFVVHFTRESS
jgi:hypothetical protein